MSKFFVISWFGLGLVALIFVNVWFGRIEDRARKKLLLQGESLTLFELHTRKGMRKLQAYAPEEDRLCHLVGNCWIVGGFVWAIVLYLLLRAM